MTTKPKPRKAPAAGATVGNGCSCKVYDGYARGTVE